MLGELCSHDIGRTLALDENLFRDSQFLRDGQHQIVVFVPLIDVHHDAGLAGFQRFAQRRHPQAVGDDVVGPAQFAAAYRVVGDVADAAFAVGGAVDGVVVAEYQHAVFGQLEVQLHDVDPHADNRLDGRNRILGVVAPVAAVGGDQHLFRGGIVDFGDDGLGTALGIRRAGMLPAGGSRESRREDQQVGDFSYHRLSLD